MKNMNTMKHLAQRIVNLYIHKALWSDAAAAAEFIQVCSQAEAARAHSNLNAHGKFILRFCNWCVTMSDRPLTDMMQDMDVFFEQECGTTGYAWEDHYVGSC